MSGSVSLEGRVLADSLARAACGVWTRHWLDEPEFDRVYIDEGCASIAPGRMTHLGLFGPLEGPAIAFRKPPVAEDYGGVAAIVAPRRTGLVFELQISMTLIDAPVQLRTDSRLRAALDPAGRLRVQDHFSASTMSEELLDCYRQMLRR